MTSDKTQAMLQAAINFGSGVAEELRAVAAEAAARDEFPQIFLDTAVEAALRVRAQLEEARRLSESTPDEIRAQYNLPPGAIGVPLRDLAPCPYWMMFYGLAHGYKVLGFKLHPGVGYGPEKSCNVYAAEAMLRVLPPEDVPAWVHDIIENGRRYAYEQEMHFTAPAGNA